MLEILTLTGNKPYEMHAFHVSCLVTQTFIPEAMESLEQSEAPLCSCPIDRDPFISLVVRPVAFSISLIRRFGIYLLLNL